MGWRKSKLPKQSQNWKEKETGACFLGPSPTETKHADARDVHEGCNTHMGVPLTDGCASLFVIKDSHAGYENPIFE